MDDLVEWLKRQLDEDERVAREAHQPNWRWYTEDKGVVTHVDDGEWDRYLPTSTRSDAAHIALHDPARVLREVEAKRRILNLTSFDAQFPDSEGGYDNACEDVIKLLALSYDDHPGYQESWRP